MATTSNAALQAEIDKIARMAVRKEPIDLRYDVNKDGRITSQDAFLVKAGRATIPTVEQYAASQNTSPPAAASQNTSPQAGTGLTASDPIQNLSKQLAGVVDLANSSGGAWSTESGRSSGPGYGPEGFLKKMAENFYNQTGLTDLNKLGYGKITTPENAPVVRQPIYGDYEYDYYTGTYTPTVTGYQWATPTADFQTDQNGFLVAGGYRALSPQEITTIKDVGNGRYTADVVVGREGYYNKDTGTPVKFDGTLGEYSAGPDYTRTKLSFTPEGKPRVTTQGESSNDLGEILPILSIALMAIPGIGQAVGAALLPTGVSTTVATAVGNAVVNAGLQVAAGAPVEQALTNAAASLGVSQLVPNLSGNSFVDNAVRSVATATLTGGDVGNALANSLIATGGNELLGNTSFTGDKVVDSAIASAITSGVQAAATSGDVGASIIRGGIAGASGQLAKEENVAESARSGAGFIGEDVTAPINVADVIGNDTVTSGSGIDSVNAGVAQDNVLDLVQQDIDRISSNNVQGNLNAEQEIQSATPVEPGASDFTIPGGTTVGEFAEPSTGGFSRTPVVTTPPTATSTSGTPTVSQDPPYVAPNGMHNRTAFIQAGGGTSDADYATYVQAVNAVISQGQSGNLIKPSSVNSAGKQLPSTTGSVTTATPSVDSVLGSVAAQGTASFGQTFGGALSALGFTDAGKAVINKANALADAATVAEGPEITVGKQYINEAIDKLASSSNARDAFINLGNLVSTIYDNPKAFGAALGSETFEELLQIGTLRGGSFLTKELIASSIENGGGAYNTEYDKQIRLGAPPEVAHESAQKAAGVAAGTTAALGLGVAGAGRLAGVGGGSTSVGNTIAKQTAQEALEAGTVTSAVDYALTGSIDVQNSLREALSDVVYGGPTSGVVQAGSNVISSQIPSSDTSSNVGVVVAVDPDTNQASVIDDGGNITIISAENLTPGQNIVLPSTPVDTSPVVDQPVVDQPVVDQPVVTAPSVTQPEVTTPIDTGPVVSTPIDTGPVVTTPDILVPPVVVNTANNTASTAPVTQPTGDEVVSQDVGQVVGTESTLPSTSTGGASTGSQVDTGSILGTGTVTTENVGAGTGAGAGVETSTGIVLQNNGDGTALVLTQDGGATNVSSVDATTGTALTPGATVTVDTSNNTATVASTATDTSTAVTSGTDTSTQADTQTQTGTQTATDTATQVQPETVTQTQPETGAQTQPEVTPTPPPLVIEPTPPTLEVTGIVLQNNGDGTVLVLTNNGNASIVSDVDSSTGGTLTTGSSVVVDNNTGTASSADTGTGTGTGTGVSDTATEAIPAVDTSGSVTAGTGVTTGDTTVDTTGATTGVTTGAVTGVTTGDQVDTGGTQLLPEITNVGGTTSTDSTGTSTLTPGINVELPEIPEPPEDITEDTVVGGGGNDLIVGGGSNDVIASEPTGTTTTEEDLLLKQIIMELETTPPVSKGVLIPEPEFPEPPLVLPESPTIDVADSLTIRPVVDRGYRRPPVSPGSRVEESAQILPIRPGLSEGGTGGIEGTTEQEQEPVWNVRSLKLRRLLGI